jgi:sulfhydrogenase subunit alpha
MSAVDIIDTTGSTGTRTVKVDYLARVEGEGGMYVKIRDGLVEDVKLKIFEPPRFFEALLLGRNFAEAPDITARICGICPVAYQMSSVYAMEAAYGVNVGEPVHQLRRLLYCGEWIESHALHVYMLHAPDFLGYSDVIDIAKDHPQIVQRGLFLKKVGNEIMTLLGGREIHPINVRVGGFYKVPTRAELEKLAEHIDTARNIAVEAALWVSTFHFPDFEQDYDFVALRHPSEYPINRGRLISNRGLDIAVDEYEQYFHEEHVAHSNALHSVMEDGRSYFVGPMARYSLNYDRLSPMAQFVAEQAGLGQTCNNPFKSIIVRAVELVYACDEALRIIGDYVQPAAPYVDVLAAGSNRGYGTACTEAPRGILYHRYHLETDGSILDAKIVPPTSQNQRRIEQDLYNFVSARVGLDEEQLTWQCEQAIRNYDPCISCATHFLKLEMDRE